MRDKSRSSLRGRPKSPAKMLEGILRHGDVKSEHFLVGIEDLQGMGAKPQLLVSLIRNAIRHNWIKGDWQRQAIAKIQRLESGDTELISDDTPPTVNPGTMRLYQKFLAAGGHESFQQWSDAMRRLALTKPENRQPTPVTEKPPEPIVTPKPKPSAWVPPRPKPEKPPEAMSLAQRQAIELRGNRGMEAWEEKNNEETQIKNQ